VNKTLLSKPGTENVKGWRFYKKKTQKSWRGGKKKREDVQYTAVKGGLNPIWQGGGEERLGVFDYSNGFAIAMRKKKKRKRNDGFENDVLKLQDSNFSGGAKEEEASCARIEIISEREQSQDTK